MKLQTTWVAGAALILTATACDSPTSITSPTGADLNPAFQAISGRTTELDVPFPPDMEPNPCNGDVVTSDGTAHFVFATTFDNTGGSHVSTQFSYRGKGVGVPSGFDYTLNEVQSTSEQQPGSAISWVEENRVIVKPPVQELTYMRHIVFKFTMNATGVPTVFVERIYTKCGTETTHVVEDPPL